MAQKKITYDDKTDRFPIIDRLRQVTAADLNELKRVINDNADDVEVRFGQQAGIPRLNKPHLVAVSSTMNSIWLSFADVNSSPSEVGIEVQWSSTGLTVWNAEAFLPANATTHESTVPSETKRYYRVRAIGDGVTSITSEWSNVVNDTTLGGSLPIVETLAVSYSNGVATLSMNISSLGGANVVQYSFYVGEENPPQGAAVELTDYAQSVGVRTGTINYLDPNKTYYFQAYASNNNGWVVGDVVSFTTGTVSVPTLVAPVLSVGTVTNSSVALSWTDPNSSPNETGIEIQWSGNGSTNWTAYASRPSGSISYVASVPASTLRYFRVRAVGNGTTGVTSLWSNFVNATTLAPSLGLPPNWYGSMMTRPTVESQVRGLASTQDDTFTINTGSNLFHIVAIRASKTLVSVIDQDAFGINLTSSYILSGITQVENSEGTLVAYKVYILEIAVPYSSNHRHNITLS